MPHVRSLVADLHSADMAELLNAFDSEQREVLLNAIRTDLEPEILVDLEPEVKDEVISQLGTEESAAAIAQLDSDDAVQVMEDLEEAEQQEILEAIPEEQHEQREALEEGLAHPEDTAGRLMDKKFVAMPESWTVGQTIDYLREEEDLPQDFYNLFIVDISGKPVGVASVSRAMRSNREVLLRDIMDGDVKVIEQGIDQEEVAYIFRKYALSEAPVVDEKGIMVARITVDDVMDVIEEEAEEDIMRMGGVGETDLYASTRKTAMHRFPWLFVNLITAIAASAIIALFDEAIEKLVALAVLMPIVASMAGNAGTQTLTVAVRAIATRELGATNAMRVVRKEIYAGLVNGLFFAAIVGVTSLLIYQNTELSAVFAFSTIIALATAACAGVAIPLILVRMGVDPAVASGVFLTTITDVSAFFVFLGLASWML